MISIRFLIWLKGHLIGKDDHGNSYYEERFLFSKPNRPPRRWVLYKEKGLRVRDIPAIWHGWLHFNCESPLTSDIKIWQKQDIVEPSLKGPRYNAWSPKDD